ncbi:MAG: PIN domain-containing protein [Pseudotabrizicola sp.]|uniref:RSP_2648 family PIN domain-containing protein n=1 Tax=Pseudotabrizicola sp. TaxID=2939647 RepID=UPI00272F9362|nr:PIN domain-containing protein [Pseudotabrizicola sp.]MDP2079761.1 PIN domain-containing protein [Pseudotabrizicola sp.]MDZ7574762.1 PIN domain-containing protein [Pseudotabrizicola sp.]
MRAVLDACVLYPTVLREILMGCAAAGLYEPLFSERILREWVRATAKLGPAQQVFADGEAAMLRANFPKAMVREHAHIEARLMLPDPNDVHVLAVAIGSSADCIVTFNAVDFPRHLLAEEGVKRCDPDGFLRDLHLRDPHTVARVVTAVHTTACCLSGEAFTRKSLLRRAKLNRLAKALDAAEA